jgi:hypothetical protein
MEETDMSDDLALEIACILRDRSLTKDAALERTAQAFVARNDSHLVAAIAWALLEAVRREGEIDWVADGLETVAPQPRIAEISSHILTAMRGLSSSEAAAGLVAEVVVRALDGLSDDGFAAWMKLAVRRRQVAQRNKPPQLN